MPAYVGVACLLSQLYSLLLYQRVAEHLNPRAPVGSIINVVYRGEGLPEVNVVRRAARVWIDPSNPSFIVHLLFHNSHGCFLSNPVETTHGPILPVFVFSLLVTFLLFFSSLVCPLYLVGLVWL